MQQTSYTDGKPFVLSSKKAETVSEIYLCLFWGERPGGGNVRGMSVSLCRNDLLHTPLAIRRHGAQLDNSAVCSTSYITSSAAAAAWSVSLACTRSSNSAADPAPDH